MRERIIVGLVLWNGLLLNDDEIHIIELLNHTKLMFCQHKSHEFT